MKRPAKKLSSLFSAFSEKVSAESNFNKKEASEYLDSDLHDDNFIMMAEIYGGDFQKVWKKTHKKWWV